MSRLKVYLPITSSFKMSFNKKAVMLNLKLISSDLFRRKQDVYTCDPELKAEQPYTDISGAICL